MQCYRLIAAVLASVVLGGCDASTTSPAPSILPSSFIINIVDFSFSPLDLAVPPGATVIVSNGDSVVHSVTSESAPLQFTPGSVNGVSFDTGAFIGQTSFTLPQNVPEGTVIPYYCKVHTATMITQTGFITVQASAAPSG